MSEQDGQDVLLSGHSFGQRTADNPLGLCVACHGTCDHRQYSRRYLRFVAVHLAEFTTIYLAPSPSSTRALQERLSREYTTLPPRHVCTCWCSFAREQQTGNVCAECQRRRKLSVAQDVAIEIGRGAMVNPPLPSVLMLDLNAGYTAA